MSQNGSVTCLLLAYSKHGATGVLSRGGGFFFATPYKVDHRIFRFPTTILDPNGLHSPSSWEQSLLRGRADLESWSCVYFLLRPHHKANAVALGPVLFLAVEAATVLAMHLLLMRPCALPPIPWPCGPPPRGTYGACSNFFPGRGRHRKQPKK